MSVTARTPHRSGRRASTRRTIAEAFQLTAAAHPDRVRPAPQGRRVHDDLGGVRRQGAALAAGLAGLGPRARRERSAIMLTNRPEFHWFDSAALHLGATPFSIYNTYTREQIQYQVERRRRRASS